jgi:uracil phosphoribosyltransferase
MRSSQLRVLEGAAVKSLLTALRNKDTPREEFVKIADRLMAILVEEALAEAPAAQAEKHIRTPCGPHTGLGRADPATLAAVSIVRSGDVVLEAVRRAEPSVDVGKVLIQRDETTADKRPILFYVKLPATIARKECVLLCDPMLATGGSACMALRELVRRGVHEERIIFVNVVSCPEGIARLTAEFPRVRIITAAVDQRLNEHKYIVPGLGDYGDRYYGTE